MATDPLSLVYDSIWTMLEAHADFASLVKVGNRTKFSGTNRNPMKEEILTADRPEVRLVATSSRMHLQRASNSSTWDVTLSLQVATGDQRLDYKIYPVMWAVFRALSTWETHVKTLTWNAKTFVHLARPQESTEGVDLPDMNKGIIGWSTIWSYEVQMHFTTADLQTV